jgi:hypothetical protein
MNDKKPVYFEKDLRRIEGDGVFSCPKCGKTLSPDDENEEAYKIVKTRTRKDDELVSMTIECDVCQSQIKLTGFSAKPLGKYVNFCF